MKKLSKIITVYEFTENETKIIKEALAYCEHRFITEPMCGARFLNKEVTRQMLSILKKEFI